jgi:hypothetical protein
MLDKGELGCFDESYQALIERRRRRPDRFWLAVWLLREGHTTKDGLRFPSAKPWNLRSAIMAHQAGAHRPRCGAAGSLSGCKEGDLGSLIDCDCQDARIPLAPSSPEH